MRAERVTRIISFLVISLIRSVGSGNRKKPTFFAFRSTFFNFVFQPHFIPLFQVSVLCDKNEWSRGIPPFLCWKSVNTIQLYVFNLTVKFFLSLYNLANLCISLCIRCHWLPPPFLFGSSLTRPRLQNSSFLSRATMDDWWVCEFNHLCSFVFLWHVSVKTKNSLYLNNFPKSKSKIHLPH